MMGLLSAHNYRISCAHFVEVKCSDLYRTHFRFRSCGCSLFFFVRDREIRIRYYTHLDAEIRFNSLIWGNIEVVVYTFSSIDRTVAYNYCTTYSNTRGRCVSHFTMTVHIYLDNLTYVSDCQCPCGHTFSSRHHYYLTPNMRES